MADKIDNRIFAEMQYATADKTAVDLLGDKPRVTKENVHDMLMAVGMTPGLGNIADAADALLYADEGEFGAAGLSAAAMIPFIGQAVSAKRAVKAAKKAGDEVVVLYRGTNWHPSKVKTDKGIISTGESMIKEGKFIGSRYSQFNPETLKYDLPEGTLWTSNSIKEAAEWGYSSASNRKRNPYIMRFEIPKKELNKLKPLKSRIGLSTPDIPNETVNFGIPEGLPKKWLTNVSKLTDDVMMDIRYTGTTRLGSK